MGAGGTAQPAATSRAKSPCRPMEQAVPPGRGAGWGGTGYQLTMTELLRRRLSVTPRELGLYLAVYIPAGFIMNGIGKAMHIAEFMHWWQVLTCYGLYLVPCSLVVRHRHWTDQYLFGLLALGLLEVSGYTLGSSIAHDGNILDAIFGPRNFTLVMTLWFGTYLPAGNAAVGALVRAMPWPESVARRNMEADAG